MSVWQPPRESEFTQPTELCPHPVWWSADNIMSTEIEVSEWIAATVKMAQPEVIVETGTHYGLTTERIAKVISSNGHGNFVSLEIDLGMYESAMHRCLATDAQLKLIDSLQYIPPQPIDFLFVDGGSDRLADVRHFLPYMKPRGIIVVHDTAHDPYDKQVPEILELCGCSEPGTGGNSIQFDTPRGVLLIKLP